MVAQPPIMELTVGAAPFNWLRTMRGLSPNCPSVLPSVVNATTPLPKLRMRLEMTRSDPPPPDRDELIKDEPIPIVVWPTYSALVAGVPDVPGFPASAT